VILAVPVLWQGVYKFYLQDFHCLEGIGSNIGEP
jgi:hypothetical protein